jgi:hypothetical protein
VKIFWHQGGSREAPAIDWAHAGAGAWRPCRGHPARDSRAGARGRRGTASPILLLACKAINAIGSGEMTDFCAPTYSFGLLDLQEVLFWNLRKKTRFEQVIL